MNRIPEHHWTGVISLGLSLTIAIVFNWAACAGVPGNGSAPHGGEDLPRVVDGRLVPGSPAGPDLIVRAVVERARFICPDILFDAEFSAAAEAELLAVLEDPTGQREPNPFVLPPGGFADWNNELPEAWGETYAEVAEAMRTDQLHTVPANPCPDAIWAVAVEAVNAGFGRTGPEEIRLHWMGGYLPMR